MARDPLGRHWQQTSIFRQPVISPATLLILRMGSIRFATSLLVVLISHVLNRVLIVEYQVPAGLIAFIFAFQHVATPSGLLAGYFSDRLKPARWRRPAFILGGMALCLLVTPFFPEWGLALAAQQTSRPLLWLGVLLFSLFGIGTTVSATAVNALLVDCLPRRRRGPAMTIVWILTLAGIIGGASLFEALFPDGQLLRLRWIFWLFAALAAVITFGSLWRLVLPSLGVGVQEQAPAKLGRLLGSFGRSGQALLFFGFLAASVFFWALHIFILTPFGGEVLGLPVGETTRFGIVTSYGTLVGMGAAYWRLRHPLTSGDFINLPLSLGLGALAFGCLGYSAWAVHPGSATVGLWLLGLAKGFYNAGLANLTMRLAHPIFGGVFMGLWNLISGLALALGEMAGGLFLDHGRHFWNTPGSAYACVFFLAALGLLGCLVLLSGLKVAKYWRQIAAPLGLPAGAALAQGELVQVPQAGRSPT